MHEILCNIYQSIGNSATNVKLNLWKYLKKIFCKTYLHKIKFEYVILEI